MKLGIISLLAATSLQAAPPYTDERLAQGFAVMVTRGDNYDVLLSSPVSEDGAANLKLLIGCKVRSVDKLATRTFVSYGIDWSCKKLPRGTKTAAVIKIADGKIYDVFMSEVL